MICFSKAQLGQWLQGHGPRSTRRRRPAQPRVAAARLVAPTIEAFETRTLLAAFSWTGATNSDWDTSANWNLTSGTDGDGVPDSDDDVTYSSGTNSPVLPGNREIGSLAGSNGTQTIDLQTFTLTVGATITSGSSKTYGGALSGTGGLTKTGAGTQKLNGFSSYSGPTTINAGLIETGDNPRSDTTNLGDGSATNSVILNGGSLKFGIGGITSPATRGIVLTANGTISDGGSTNTINGVISGAFNLTKSGSGQLTLGGVNTFGGVGHTLTLDGGQVFIAADSGFGDSSNSVVFSQTTIVNTTASFSMNRSMTLTGGGTFRTQGATTLTLAGAISGAGTLQVQSNPSLSGLVVLTNSGNTYTGTTNVSTGNLRVTANDALGGTTNGVTTTNGVFVDFQNVAYTTTEPFSLSAGATLRNSSGISSFNGTVNLSGAGTILVDGTELTLNGVLSNSNGFTKTGSGILALAATNTFTGASTISVGTLLVNGSTASGASFAVSSGATIGGTGTISGAVTLASGATMAPGASPESLGVGDFTSTAGSNVVFEIGGTTAGTNYDQIIATGTVTLGDATLVLTPFNAFVPSAGQIYTIIDKTSAGAVSGTFLGLAEGALVSNFIGSGNAAYISYIGGDGNDVILTTNTAPVLDATHSPALTNLDTDDQTSTSDTVADIVVNGSITDVDTVTDPESIAVTSIDNTNGVWQYSTDGGGSWLNFSATTGAIVDLSAASRLLLPAHQVRFVPNLTYIGYAAFSFRAWDQTTGTAGSTADTTTHGGMTAYSATSDSASLFVGTIETSVSIDGSGNLVVTDINGGMTSDTLTVQADTGAGTIIVSDPNHVFETSVGTLSADFHSVTVPIASITGSQILFDALAGSDSLTVDYSLGNFSKSINFIAGNPTAAPGDSLTLTSGTFSTVTHTLTNATDGTIDITDNASISYTGLEPVIDNLSATDRVFTFTGGAETITVTDSGGADGKTTIDSTLGESVTFTNPSGSLTINAGTGDDTITITSVDSAYTAALTINGADGTDTINSNTVLTLGSGTSTGAVSLTAETIAVSTAINTIATTTGSISLSGTTISLGANLSTDSAAVSIVGSTSVSLISSVTIDTEAGNDGLGGAVSFAGTGQLQPDGTPGRDLTINTATTFAAATGGAVTLPTIGLNATYLNDINVDSRATTNGVITIGGDITTDDNGVSLSGTITLAGDVRLTGTRTLSTADADTNGGAIDLSQATVSATVAAADFTFHTQTTKAGGTSGLVTLGSFSNGGGQFINNLTIDTNDSSTTAGDITFNSAATLSGSLVAEGRTISLPNTTSDVVVSSANSIDLTATRNINLASGSSLASVNGNITLSANQQATATTGDFTGILLTSASITASGTGSINLTGKGGTGASENDGVRITDDNTGGIGTLSAIATTTGSITMSGATNTATSGDDGVHIEDATINASSTGPITITGTGANSSTSEGVYLAGATSFAKSAGGAIAITGTSGGDDGVEISEADITNQGTGTLTITGTGGSVSATSDGVLIAGNGSSLISVDNGAMQIMGTGGRDDGIDSSGALIRTTGSGNLTITGTGGSVAEGDGIVVTGASNQFLTSGTGNITLSGTATVGDGVELTSTLTLAASATSSGLITITGDGGGAGAVGAQIDAPLTSNSGAITISSSDNVTFAATGDITTTSGSVTILATSAGGQITSANGALINAGNNTISLTADGHITLGGLLTTNATATAITVTATNGEILDGGDAHVDVVANSGTATFTAADGIGATLGSGGTAAIEITVAQLVATTTNAPIDVLETDALSAIDLNAGASNIALTASGAITDTDAAIDITATNAFIEITGLGAEIGSAANAIEVNVTTLRTLTNAADQYLETPTSLTISTLDFDAGTAHTVHLVEGTFLTTDAGGDILSHVEVQSGAALAGNGDVTGSVLAHSGSGVQPGFDAPAIEPGLLTVGNTTLDAGSTYFVQIGGNTPGNTANDHDQLIVVGSVTINGATLNVSSINGYVPQDGDFYTIIDNNLADAIVGTFAGFPPDFVTNNFLGSGLLMQINYDSGDGNDVVLAVYAAETSVELDGAGNLVVTDINGGTSNDNLTITLNGAGTHYVLSDPTHIITTSIAGATGNGTFSISVPIASVTGDIQFHTLAGNDAVTVDLSLGSFPNNVALTGGTPHAAPGDTLILTGNPYATVTHTATGLGAGNVEFSGTTMTVTYSEIEDVQDELAVQNRVFVFDGGTETITLNDDADAADSESTITSTVGTRITFDDPTVSLDLNAGAGNDNIILTALDANFSASLSIDGAADADSMQMNSALTLGSGVSLGTVVLVADSIAINAAINTTAVTTGFIALSGTTITLADNLSTDGAPIGLAGSTSVSVTSTTVIDTETGANNNAGAIDFTGTGFLTGTNADLTLHTDAVGQIAGNITLPTIQLSGGDGLNDLLVTADGATDGMIALGGHITVDDNGVGDLSSITMIGQVCLPASRTINTSDSETNGGAIDFSNSVLSASVAGANLALTSGYTGLGIGDGGAVTLGLVDNSCGQNIDDLEVDALSTSGTAGNVALTNTTTLDGSLSVSSNEVALTTANADITVSGAGSVTLSGQETVSLASGSSITAVHGNVILNGNSAGTATTDSIGIALTGANITTTGTGHIILTGQGGADVGTNLHFGISIDAASTLNTTGSGTITLNGTGGGGGGSDFNQGISLAGTITATNASILLTGTAGVGGNSFGINLAATAIINSSNNPISFTSDLINIIAGASSHSGTATTTITQLTNSTNITLGAADVTGTLGLTDAELDALTAATLSIGNAQSSEITISDSITRPAATDINVTTGNNNSITFSGPSAAINTNGGDLTLGLNAVGTGAVVSGDAATDITADGLVINSASGGIGANGNSLTFDVNTIATLTTNADQFLNELNTVTVASGDLVAGSGTVHLVTGTFITTATGTIPGATDIESGATLAGIGSNGPVHNLSGGTINPGTPTTGVGTLGTGNLALDAGSTYIVNANLPSAGNYDSLSVTGTVDVTGSTLSVLPVAGFGAASMIGVSVVVIANDGADAVVGEFAGLPEGAVVTLDGVNFAITYVGGDGNDIALTRPILDVYVDDDWALLPNGTDPDGAGPANAIGVDAFAIIQDGVNAVVTNGTVHVYAGPYPENVTINKNVTILGENGHVTGAEADLIDVDANGGVGFTITGSKVTLNNVSIDDSSNGIVFSGATSLTLIDIVSKNATGSGFVSTSLGDITLSGGTFDGLNINDADDITLTGSNIAATDNVLLSAKNSIDIDTHFNAGASTVTIAANADGTGTEGFELCGFAITTTNDTAAAISITVNTLLGGTGSAHLDVLTTGTTAGPAGGRVTVDANAGAIEDCNAVANNITAGNAILRGLAGVGTLADPIETTVSRLEGAGGSGGFFELNTSSLAIGGITAGTTGISTTTGSIDIRVDGALTIEENVTTTGVIGNIVIKANENPGTGRDLTVNAGVTLSSSSGNIALDAGDNLTVQAGSILSASAGTIALTGDSDDTDAEGSAISVSSQLLSTGTSISGGNDNDTYLIAYPLGVFNAGAVTISDSGGTDSATVAGTTGDDLLFFTSANPPTTITTEQVTRSNVTDEPVIIPNMIEAFTLAGDIGNDTFTVQPSTFFPIVVNGNAPTFGDPTVPPGDQLILDTFGNNFTLNGKSIQVSGTQNGQTFGLITPINIENVPLAPISPTVPQRYDFNATNFNSALNMFVQTPTQPGWTGVMASTLYSDGLGYGWSVPLADAQGSSDTTVDGPLVNDGHVWYLGLNVGLPQFVADVPNGWVSVTIDYGHPTAAIDGLRIRNFDTGEFLATDLNTQASQSDHQTYFFQVTDGTLNLLFDDGAGFRFFAINGIDIRPAALFTMGFSNLPASALTADGTTIDNFTLTAGPSSLLVTIEASLGTLVGVDADPYLEGFQVLTDAGGSANVSILRPSGAGTSTILMTTPTGEDWGCQSIDYSLAGLGATGRNFDFNTTASGIASPTQAGYQPVAPSAVYSSSLGYGWTTTPLPSGLSNGTTFNASSLPDAFNDGQSSFLASTFRVDLPNGTYAVHYAMGDSSDHNGVDIFANGTPVVTDLSLLRQQITEESFLVTVTNGRLELTFNPGSGVSINPSWVLNALQILPMALVGSVTPINVGTVPADGTTITAVDATSTLPVGTLVTVSSTLGTVTTPDADPTTAGVQVLVGVGGTISFDLQSPTLAGTPTVEWRTLDGTTDTTITSAAFLNFALTAIRRFDFGGGHNDSTMTNVAAGFIGVRTNHNPTVSGFGWTTPVGAQLPTSVPTNLLTTALYTDGHTGHQATIGQFLVQANTGTLYDVRVYVGSLCFIVTSITVTVEGTASQTVSTTAANPFAIVTAIGANDTNGDGVITVQIQDTSTGLSTGWAVAGLDIATTGNLPPVAPLIGTSFTSNTSVPRLTMADLTPIVAYAQTYYATRDALTADELHRLRTVRFEITDLSTAISGPATLGLASEHVIQLDDNGAGLGWDITPESVDAHRYDLLSAVIHEFGHVLGHEHQAGGLMSEHLTPGQRAAAIDALFADGLPTD